MSNYVFIGKVCILVVDPCGHGQVKLLHPHASSVFIAPPSKEELVVRLSRRGTETESTMANRLKHYTSDMDYSQHPNMFDLKLVNDDLEQAYDTFKTYCETLVPQ